METPSSRSEATHLLEEAELRDGYRAACAASAPNAFARRYCLYRPFFVEEAAAERLQRVVDAIPLLQDTTVVVMHPTADEGYPQTRPPNLVLLPTKMIPDRPTAELAETLRHEAIHIDQRRRPAVWVAACQQRGWQPVAANRLPDSLLSRCRINPDTMSPHPFWAWDTHHVPLPLFSSEQPNTIADVVIKWLDLRSRTVHKDPPASFVSVFGASPSQPEHPYEIYAVEAAAKGIFTKEALDAYLRPSE
jgi:hypothetical protein